MLCHNVDRRLNAVVWHWTADAWAHESNNRLIHRTAVELNSVYLLFVSFDCFNTSNAMRIILLLRYAPRSIGGAMVAAIINKAGGVAISC